MKAYIYPLIIAIFGFVLSGCGGSNSKPKQDGKGDIDLVNYLPAKDMKKEFTFGHYGHVHFGSEGYQEITVEGNKINIEQHASEYNPYTPGEVIQKRSIIYDDMNITYFFAGETIEPYTPKLIYRHIDINEPISEGKEIHTISLDYDSELQNIGTSLVETFHECFYKDIVHSIKDRNGNIIENDGDFLVVACNVATQETYTIYPEYREIDDRNGKSDYSETKYLSYYKKGVGLIYLEGVDRQTTKPCKHKSQCIYDDFPSGYVYRINHVEYR